MQIDWFTFGAQIINFLILLWLLQRFLYGPIMRTMEAREQKLAAQFAEAEAKQRAAEDEKTTLENERRELNERREEFLQEARAEAAERRRHLIQEARAETEALTARWYEAIEREKQTFLREVQTRMGEQLMHLLRKSIGDLAGMELERAIVDKFVARVQEEAEVLREAVAANTGRKSRRGNGESPVFQVRTSFELPDALKSTVRDTLLEIGQVDAGSGREQGENGAGAERVQFSRSGDLVCGIEVVVGSHRVAWTIRDYLDELEQNLETAILQGGVQRIQTFRDGDNGVGEILPG